MLDGVFFNQQSTVNNHQLRQLIRPSPGAEPADKDPRVWFQFGKMEIQVKVRELNNFYGDNFRVREGSCPHFLKESVGLEDW